MIRSRLEKVFFVGAALSLASLLPWFASCAANEEEAVPQEDSSAIVPPPSGDGGGGDASADVVPEASCDASDPTCASGALTCDNAAWCPVATPVSTLYSLTSLWGSGPNDVWAAGSGGNIMHYDGAKWTLTPTNVRNTFYALWGSGPNDVWAVSMTDVLLHTTGFAGGGATWTKVNPAQAEANDMFPRATFAVWGTGSDDVHVGARDRTVFDPGSGDYPTYNQYVKTSGPDGGIAWRPEPGFGAVHGFWGSSKDDVWYIADNSERNGWQRGITQHGVRAVDAGAKGFTWSAVDSQTTTLLEAIWGSSKNDVWVVGDQGVIRHMTPGAVRWAIVPSPTTEALHALWGTAANDIWAVGDYGTILHYDGAAWTKALAALPAGKTKPHLYGVWGSSKNDVWIVGDGITLHYTGPKAGSVAAGGN